MIRPKVGIDLAPASLASSAPGTARHVTELGKALARLDVPWDWVPVLESEANVLRNCFPNAKAIIVPGRSFAKRAWWKLGQAWAASGCQLGFATSAFVPWFGPPCVANLFDSNIYEHGDTWIKSGSRFSYWLNRLASDHAVWRSQRLFVDSDYCRAYLQKRFPQSGDKFVTVPCGLSSMPAPSKTSPVWSHTLTGSYFIYVGTFSENKNQRRLIETWTGLQAKYADLPALVLPGPCPEEYKKSKLETALAQLPRPDEVVLPGRISDEDLSWAYAHALGAIQPSIAEGFGLPIIEAMSFGLPVACSNTTSLPETAGDAALLFDPCDPDSIAESVCKIWREPELRKSMAEKSMTRSRQFTWQRSAELAATCIENVLRTQKGTS